MKKLITLFHALYACLLVSAQIGTLDPSFGTNGYILTQPTSRGPATSFAKQCFLRSDGKLDLVLSNLKAQISRRLPNGEIDTTYAHHGFSDAASMIPSCAALQTDGKIVVAGTTNGSNHFMLVRYNTDGTIDPSFGNNGAVITDLGSPSDFLNTIVLTAAGKILVGGGSSAGGIGHSVIVQYTANGLLDLSFGTGGIVRTHFDNNFSSVISLALQSDG